VKKIPTKGLSKPKRVLLIRLLKMMGLLLLLTSFCAQKLKYSKEETKAAGSILFWMRPRR
jgi:hypothetical protein